MDKIFSPQIEELYKFYFPDKEIVTHEMARNRFVKFIDKPFRDHQEETIDYIVNSKKKIVIIKAPTGFGKSLTGVCAGEMVGDFTYLVSSKQLQDQLQNDFPEIPMLKGRSNYQCMRFPFLTCEDCTHKRPGNVCPYRRNSCTYEECQSAFKFHQL